MAGSLTAKSAKNSIVALVFYVLNIALQFVSRKIFIDYLGEELLGLNTTITSLLQFLNIAELGIGSAIGYTLYKPLFENDTQKINEVVALQGWLYKRIALVIIASGVVLMFFFPLIFEKSDLPLWYSYATFLALLFSSLLSYFVNYRQIVLSADQKEYKIQYSYKTAILLKLVFQIICIYKFDNGYMWWLVLEVMFAIIASISLNYVIKRSYPYLKGSSLGGKELIEKHNEVLVKTKQLFFHKIGGFALNRVSPIIVYGIATLEAVAIYGNYMLIMTGVTSLITAIFNSMNAGVGHLVAAGDKERIMRVFKELFSVRFLFTITICFSVYELTQPFMELWMGESLMLDDDCVILFVLITFINLNRLTPDAFINAYGLFGDIWSPIVETLLNIGLSILFGCLWGLKGILMGVFVSLFIIVFCWKQYFLFYKGFKESILWYIKMYVVHFALALVSYPIIEMCYKNTVGDSINGALSWLLHACAYTFIALLILGVIMFIFTDGMKYFVARVRGIVCRKFNCIVGK